MGVFSYASYGFEGKLVAVEVDIRSGIPTTEIVGLPGGAIRESKQRVRVAIGNAGLVYPLRKVLVNLAPAGVKKGGAAFDLPIALAILLASGQVTLGEGISVLALGELELSGRVRSVAGVLAGVALALRHGVRHFFVPTGNAEEASALEDGAVWPVDDVTEAVDGLRRLAAGSAPITRPDAVTKRTVRKTHALDFADIRGQALVKRAMEVAAAGGHNTLLFGSQGIGKTMAAIRMPSILPRLDRDDALVVTRLHSLAGLLPDYTGIIQEPVLRAPHHSASLEGMLGGGRSIVPGEVSLAHCGVLFLDEVTEYRRDVLQALREPTEARTVTIVRAGRSHTFPAAFQLVAAANPCPCGNLGHPRRRCLCGFGEIERYWKRFGGPLLDRIDMRILVTPADPTEVLTDGYESSASMKSRVLAARHVQSLRYEAAGPRLNAHMGPADIRRFCHLNGAAERAFQSVCHALLLSTRAAHSVLKVGRTIADLEESETIDDTHILEAAAYRRWGDAANLIELSRRPVATS